MKSVEDLLLQKTSSYPLKWIIVIPNQDDSLVTSGTALFRIFGQYISQK